MNPTGRFADRAADYVVGRPSYPDAAIDALFDGLGDPREVLVADVGAGTGISSRLLAARGAHVLAIEPNAAMRQAAEPHADVEYLDATGESTGLEEASVDLVTAFQAFHWVDHAKALREFVRILRPGGRAAVVYNERDERDPFTAAYGALVRRYSTDNTEQWRENAVAAFEAFEAWHTPRRLTFYHAHVLDLDGVIARARSSSYLPKDGPAGEALHAEIRDLVARFARDGVVTMAIETIVAMGDVGGDGA
jgi:SAM-dependent methyltransferase